LVQLPAGDKKIGVCLFSRIPESDPNTNECIDDQESQIEPGQFSTRYLLMQEVHVSKIVKVS